MEQNTHENTRAKEAAEDKRPFIRTIEDFKKAMREPYMELRIIICKYRLTAEICADCVIFNERYGSSDEDTYISKNDILELQPHITREELDELY